MYKYDDILMGYEVAALRFLTEDCGLNKEEALKFLKRYWQRKEYEKLALSMETDVTVVEDELKEMTSEIDKMLENQAKSK